MATQAMALFAQLYRAFGILGQSLRQNIQLFRAKAMFAGPFQQGFFRSLGVGEHAKRRRAAVFASQGADFCLYDGMLVGHKLHGVKRISGRAVVAAGGDGRINRANGADAFRCALCWQTSLVLAWPEISDTCLETCVHTRAPWALCCPHAKSTPRRIRLATL